MIFSHSYSLLCAVGAPAFDGQLYIVTLKASSQRGLQACLQLLTQANWLLGIIKAKYPCTARTFEMPMLMLGRMFLATGSFTACAIAKHPVIARNFMCQPGIGQAIQRSVQGDSVHLWQSILYFEMGQGALAGQ
jgi:hypothetical protein